MTFRQGARRIMTKFSLNEVSFVDRPAQTPAVADIAKASIDELLDDNFEKTLQPNEGEKRGAFIRRFMASDEMADEDEDKRREEAGKRFDKATAEKRGDLVHLLTSAESGHQHGISIHGSSDGIHLIVSFAQGADEEGMHDHQVVRNEDGSYTVSENRGHNHTIDAEEMGRVLLAAMNKAAEDPELDHIPLELGGALLADLPEVKKASETATDDEGDTQMSAEDLKKAKDAQAAAEAKVATLEKVAALSGVHKSHYDSLDADLDDAARKAFLDMDKAARDAEVAKAAAAAADTNPVVYKAANGDEFRKNDDPRLIKMAQERDTERKELALEKAKTADADLEKRAEALDNLPGDLKVRKAIIKAVDGIEDDEVRKAAHDALAAKNAAMHGQLTEVGTAATPVIAKSGSQSDAEAELDRLAKELASKDGIDYFDAYQKVADSNQELVNKALAG